MPKYGASSSMAEHLTVDQVVEGSTPFWHPNNQVHPPGGRFYLSNYETSKGNQLGKRRRFPEIE
jgi:hypothetical protein